MKITRQVTKPVEVVEDVFCNLCGLSCKSPMGEYYGLIEAEVTAGYESTHLKDGDVHKFSLCERCLSEMISRFHFPSFQRNYLVPEIEPNDLVTLDDLDSDEIVTALNLDEPILGDDSYQEDDSDQSYYSTWFLDYSSLQEEYMTEEERARMEEFRSIQTTMKKRKEDLN